MAVALWPSDTDALADVFARAESDLMGGPVADVAYQQDPVGWVRDVLGVPEATIRWSLHAAYRKHRWDGTQDPMVAVADGLVAWQNVGVESATTTGKTFWGACLVLWFLACFEDALVVTVAPKKDQLTLHIWKEITRLWPRFKARFPTAELQTLKIRMRGGIDETWAATGFVAGVSADEVEGSATKAQGFHAEHALFVFEETPGIAGAILTAFKNTCRAPHNLRLAFGNPDHQLDELHRFCLGPRTRHVIVSAYDHPNVVADDPNLIPGAVSRQGIDDALADAEIDGGAESRMFKSRVRGISPAESVEALIRLEWCNAAADRWAKGRHKTGVLALGVDVANSESGDKGAIAKGDGGYLAQVRAFACPSASQLGDRLTMLGRKLKVAPELVGVDSCGVGAETVKACLEADYAVTAINSGAPPIEGAMRGDPQTEWTSDSNRFANLRAQMWWQLRLDLQHGRIALPPDPALFRELTLIEWEPKNGRVVVQSKHEIRKVLGGRSPDMADAVVYWNWIRVREAQTVEAPFDRNKHPGHDYETRSRKRPDKARPDDRRRQRQRQQRERAEKGGSFVTGWGYGGARDGMLDD